MKKLITTASPFLMLLIPVFLCIGILLLNTPAEIPAEKLNTHKVFQLPSLKVFTKALF